MDAKTQPRSIFEPHTELQSQSSLIFCLWPIPIGPGRVITNLVLDQELDTLNGGSSGLGDSGGDTTH
jgi:hypothetical protein